MGIPTQGKKSPPNSKTNYLQQLAAAKKKQQRETSIALITLCIEKNRYRSDL